MSSTPLDTIFSGKPRHVRVIMNNLAAADVALRDLIGHFRNQGQRIEVRTIWEPGDATYFAREAAEQGVEVVVAAGGDGTLNEVINGVFLDSKRAVCAVAVLPYGTANDFASSCGLMAQDPLGLQWAFTDQPVWIDCGKANERLFVNVASGGFAAEITTETTPEAKRLLGGVAYLLTGLTSVGDVTSRPVRLTAPDFFWEGDLLGLTVGNGRQAGGGFEVAPKALLNDGLLDAMIIPASSWGEMVTVATDLARLNTEFESQRVVTLRCPWLEVEAPDGLQVNVDGEPLFSVQFRFEILPHSLPCCLPPGVALLGAS